MSIHFTVDIGNTAIHFGVFKGRSLVADFKLPTNKQKSSSFYQHAVQHSLSVHKVRKETITHIIIGSVVPSMTAVVREALQKIFKKKVLVAGQHVNVPIANKYKNPRLVGVDRLLAAFAALRLYGPGIIIVDFGTAVTFDIVSKNAEYLGGLIFPGVDLSLDALFHHTALLPRISVSQPKRLVGNDTQSAITAGITFGMAGACNAIIERLLKQYRGYKIIATGGSVDFIRRYCKKIRKTNPSLVMQGLSFLLTD